MSSHSLGHRKALLGVLILLSAIAAVIVLIVCLHTPLPTEALIQHPHSVAIRIVSSPEGASVFDQTGFLGAAPVEVLLGVDEVRHLRLLRLHCTDGRVTIRGSDYVAGGVKAGNVKEINGRAVAVETVALATAMKGSLSVVCSPEDADVFLNGQRLGSAPIWKDGLLVGTYRLQAEKKDYMSFERTIEIKAGEEVRVKCVLESKWGALYRKKVAERPALMTLYSEMAHYFTIMGKFKKAEDAVWAGVEIMRKKKRGELSSSEVNDYGGTVRRFTSEILHIYTDYFAYPREGSDETIRAACLKAMEAIDDEALSGSVGRKYVRRMRNYKRH